METSAMIQEVMDMLPATVQGESNVREIERRENVVLNNMLLTKESEIAALKEVLSKWKQRALDAESNAYFYYLDQIESIQLQHEIEIKSLESRYTRKLSEQDDVISVLKEQVDFLIVQNSHRLSQHNGDTDSSTEEDTQSVISSIYDREVEQGLVHSELLADMKSETILCNIQNTMRAIEFEINTHHHQPTQGQKRFRHRRSPTLTSENTTYSSSTLIDSETNTTKKIKKKSPFFINRIFKKAFPKFYTTNSFPSTKSLCSSWSSFNNYSVKNDPIPNRLDRTVYSAVV